MTLQETADLNTKLIRKIITDKEGSIEENFKYIKAKEKFEVTCQEGHRWKISWDKLKGGRWCPKCADIKTGQRSKIDKNKIIEFILSKNGSLTKNFLYKNQLTKFSINCEKGHEFVSSWSYLHQGKWCPQCKSKFRKYNIEFCINIAKEKEGKCLSVEYINPRALILWSCKEDHQWKTSLDNILHGHWCPYCCKSKPLNIEIAKKLAEEHRGECLSIEYTPKKSLIWKCEKGHIWKARLESIKNANTWCMKCFQKNFSLDDAKKFSEKHNGICLSTEYIPGKKLTWQCNKGHIWKANLYQINHRNSWCPECFGNKRLTLEAAHEIAQRRGGLCLSTEYTPKKKLKWQCNKGHIWTAKIHTLKRKDNPTWCPHCSTTISENNFRKKIESILQSNFPKTKPEWLKYPLTGRFLELDGYNDPIKIAFEYQGPHHYKPFYYDDYNQVNFEKTIKRDDFKRKKCEEMGVLLIIVPHWISPKDWEKLILGKTNEFSFR